jgi:hypothetical protein
MDLDRLNTKIESDKTYKFALRHKKVITIIEGLFIVLLLISINIYIVKDHFIKKQIKENCRYTTDEIECVCGKNFVDGWKELKDNKFEINFSEEDIKLVR